MTPVVHLILRSGGDYNHTHVARLRAQIVDCDVRVISDCGVGMPMLYRYPGWWSKMELFRSDIPGDVFFMDLDSRVCGPVAPLATCGVTTLLSDFYRPQNLQSSVMYITAADRARVAAAWFGRDAEIIARFRKLRAGFNGDQNFIQEVLGVGVARWQNTYPGAVCSYKVHVRPSGHIPAGTRIVAFHGKPRPWDVRL